MGRLAAAAACLAVLAGLTVWWSPGHGAPAGPAACSPASCAALNADLGSRRAESRASRARTTPAPAPVAKATPKPKPHTPNTPAIRTTPTVTPRPPASGPTRGVWAALADCESSGDPQAVDPSGTYFGLYQFDLSTWQANGGTGNPAAATPAEQLRVAKLLQARRGWSPWPACARKLGLL